MKTITHKSEIKRDEYTNYVCEAFDIQDQNETLTEIKYDLSKINDFDWNIGVIFGSSGSGKTSILKDFGEVWGVDFDDKKSLISNFDFLEPDEAASLLTSIGLSSVPTWLRPFKLLSNGEQYRAKLAYLIADAEDEEIILIDEYTSVVDRDVAKSMSFSLQKYIRKHNKKIILASCHYDIMEWLMPDWTCSPQKGGALEKGDWLRHGRPKIELQIARVEYGAWDLFKKHHYLTSDCSKSCKFLLFSWNGVPVGINAIISQPSGHFKNGFRESRLVVLPDFQGMGLGSEISRLSAGIIKADGGRYFTKTIHPALGAYRNKHSDIWKGTSKNGKQPKAQNKMGNMDGWKVLVRTSFCHEYIGEPLFGFEDLILPIKEARKLKLK